MAEGHVPELIEEEERFVFDGRGYLFEPRYTLEEVMERRERARQLAEEEREREENNIQPCRTTGN